MKHKLALTTALLSILISQGCKKNGGGPSKESTFTDQLRPAEPVAAPTSLLDGKWQSTCVRSSDFGISESTSMEVKSDEVKFTTTKSREADCSLPDVVITQLSKLDSVPSPQSATPTEIALSTVSMVIEPVSAVGVSTLNILSLCKVDNWVSGEEREVTSTVFSSAKGCVQLFHPKSFIQESGALYFGGGGAATDPGSIERVKYFRKQ